MKQLLILPLIFISLFGYSTTYYVSNSGNNQNNGTSVNTPWAGIDKVNSFNFTSSDIVLFKRSETFYGGIKVAVNISAYGTGAKPIITGFTVVPAWVNLGGNIWESTTAVSTLSTCNMVSVNGEFAAIGRYPNADAANGGYLTYNTTASPTIVKCTELAGVNWTGADVVMKVERYIISRRKIAAQSIDNITFNPIYVYKPKNNFGLFIQNDERTLDQLNEWYFNPITKKLKIYSSAPPVNIQLSTIDTLVRISANNIKISDIEFSGSNSETIAKPNINGYSNISIKNCILKFGGCNAINFKVGANLNILIDSCVISNTNSNGIILGAGCDNAILTNNYLQNTGAVVGMSKDSLGNYWGISTGGKGTLIEKNIVKNTGYVGISFTKDYSIVRNNLVDTFSHILDDGGGIYTFTGSSNTNFTGRKIESNIVMNGIGAKYGAGPITSTSMAAEGIYLDDNSSGVEITGNTVINCVKSGILLHNARNINLKNNTLYNNNFGLALSHDNNGNAITGVVIKNNIFSAKEATKFPATFFSIANDYANIGILDSNVYARPISDSATIKMEYPNMGWGYKTLAFWQAYTGKDLNSKKSFRSILNVNELDFQYNATSTSYTYNFNGLSKKDLLGNVYNNSIVIPAWGSKILLSNSAISITNKLPIANAGINKIIVLPANTTTLSGSGTDTDGSINSYKWVRITGDTVSKILSANSATTVVTNLLQGVYLFELTVADNMGAIGKDTVEIQVNAVLVSNISPVANAGFNTSITLPKTTTTVSGTGSDIDGTIIGYSWVKISGPALANIVNPNAAISSINGLLQGVYQFELTVTDNNGAKGKDTLEIQVNALVSLNIKPVANAGFNTVITLPKTTTTVSGSGTDKDGTIVKYNWIKISGPTVNIVNPNSVSSSINGLQQGVYQFELTVTDNNGATGKDTTQLIVNPVISNLLAVAKSSNVNSIGSKTLINTSKIFQISCYPNPTTTDFGLNIEGGTNENVDIIVSNANGQIVYKINSTSNKIYRFGNDFIRGFYIIKVVQGDNVQVLKVIKL